MYNRCNSCGTRFRPQFLTVMLSERISQPILRKKHFGRNTCTPRLALSTRGKALHKSCSSNNPWIRVERMAYLKCYHSIKLLNLVSVIASQTAANIPCIVREKSHQNHGCYCEKHCDCWKDGKLPHSKFHQCTNVLPQHHYVTCI
jgi:hypothetical protein